MFLTIECVVYKLSGWHFFFAAIVQVLAAPADEEKRTLNDCKAGCRKLPEGHTTMHPCYEGCNKRYGNANTKANRQEKRKWGPGILPGDGK